jgi:hypothetical protein
VDEGRVFLFADVTTAIALSLEGIGGDGGVSFFTARMYLNVEAD